MPTARTLPVSLMLYCVASFVHFAHNVWLGITALGVLGYRLRRRFFGLAILAVYAAIGFDGLLHYTRAPFDAHTGTMNVTIWSEVVAAALLLAAVLKRMLEQRRSEL